MHSGEAEVANMVREHLQTLKKRRGRGGMGLGGARSKREKRTGGMSRFTPSSSQNYFLSRKVVLNYYLICI